MKCCGMCGVQLGQLGKPATMNCGGDCLACVADHGDPDCREVMRVLNGDSNYAVGPYSRVRYSVTRFYGLHLETFASPRMREGRAGDLVYTILGEAVPGLLINTKYLR